MLQYPDWHGGFDSCSVVTNAVAASNVTFPSPQAGNGTVHGTVSGMM